MASTVEELVESADCEYGGKVSWGSAVPESRGGIYLIAVTPDPRSRAAVSVPPIDSSLVEQLIDVRPGLTLDGNPPSVQGLLSRLAAMWIPDEPVIYIGKATSLAARVGQYYNTRLGARSPHAGGWPLKVLSNIEDLTVHWARSPMPELAEQKALAAFVNGVSDSSKRKLQDPDHPYPYANLEGPGGRKRHGMLGAREPTRPRSPKSTTAGQTTEVMPKKRSTGVAEQGRTQRVTATDLKAGRIRIPRKSKTLFPPERTDIDLTLRSKRLTVRWDPRMGPPERSGTLGIGRRTLAELVSENEALDISRTEGHIFLS